MRTLCFSIILLDGRLHGQGDRNQPEWPPSPWRLCQALLAGAHTGCHHAEWSDAHTRAFRWLERRKPPIIISPEQQKLSQYAISVPNNDTDILARTWAQRREPQKKPEQLRTLKTLRPSTSATGQPVVFHYLYELTEDDETAADELNTLCQVARCLHTFGWGIDAAIACARVLSAKQALQLPGIRWRPHHVSRFFDTRIPVPKEGSLDNLVHCYKQFISSVSGRTFRKPARPSVYDRVAYLRDTTLPLVTAQHSTFACWMPQSAGGHFRKNTPPS